MGQEVLTGAEVGRQGGSYIPSAIYSGLWALNEWALLPSLMLLLKGWSWDRDSNKVIALFREHFKHS